MMTADQEKRTRHFLQRYRDRLAAAIVHEGLRDAREFKAVCDLLLELRPVQDGPPPGMVDRRRLPR
jgi:hypothetical protein